MPNIRFIDSGTPVGAYGIPKVDNATSSSFATSASFASTAITASHALFAVSASVEITKEISSSHANRADVADSGNGIFSGSFSGSYEGNGSGLTNIPASGIVGLNLSQIADGTATASISETNGFIVNTDSKITGSLEISGSSFKVDTSLGTALQVKQDGTIVLGANTSGATLQGLPIGYGAAIYGGVRGVAVGYQSSAASNSVGIGGNASAAGAGNAVVVGGYASATANKTVAIGYDADVSGIHSIAIGSYINASGTNSITLNSSTYGGAVSTSTANSFEVYMTSNSTPDFQVTNTHITASGNISGSSISTASFGTYLGDGSQLSGITPTAGSSAGRVVFTTTNGELTAESGFEYDSATDQLTVQSLNVTHLTSSFITASTIQTSGSNIFGDDTTDTQTLIGTTIMTGSAQVTGSLTMSGLISIPNSGSGITIDSGSLNVKRSAASTNIATFTPLNSAGRVEINDAEVKVTDTAYGYTAGKLYSSYQRTGEFSLHYWSGLTGVYIQGNANEGGSTWQQNFIGGGLHVGSRKTAAGNSVPFAFSVKGPSQLSGSLLVSGSVNIEEGFNISGSSTSTASFGTYLGDGSQLTGIVTATDLSSSIFVSPSGNDITGTVGDLMKPFATLESASQAATTGSTIFVYPGTYIAPAENLAFEGGSYYFHPNTVVSKSAAGPVFKSTGFSNSFNVYGHADFYLTSSCEEVLEAGASSNPAPGYTFECRDIRQLCGGDYAIQTTINNGGSTTDIAIANISFRRIHTDGGGISIPGPYTTQKGSYYINCSEIYADGGSGITTYQGWTFLQVNATRIVANGGDGIRSYYSSQTEINVGYLYGSNYGYTSAGAGYITINGTVNSISNAMSYIQHNGHTTDLDTTGGTYHGNSVEGGTWSGGDNNIIWSPTYTELITVTGGNHRIDGGGSSTYFPKLNITDGLVYMDGYSTAGNSNYHFEVGGGELIYKGHLEYSTNDNGDNQPFDLYGGVLRIQGYVKNQLNDSEPTPQNYSCVHYRGGTLILDGATLITSASVAPPVTVQDQDRIVKIFSGGVNTNKTGSLGLLQASSSFSGDRYALTNPLGGMIIEDASVE